LLAFSRRQPLVPAPVDIAAMLFGMSGLIHSALGDRIRLFTRFEPGLWSAMVDRTQIELVVLNLVINARDAMPDGGTLTVTAVNASVGAPILPEQPPAGEYVRITLADSGTGMTPEVRARAFEPFFTTKGPGKGSGLGLSQVYGVARQSGGGVQIESAPGVGTSVSVFLPRAAAIPARSAPVPPAAVARDGGVAILLVDDDAAVRATTGELLLLYGYRIVDADSGAAALALLETGVTVDVVVTDVAMPGMTGPELARELRARWPRLPVVFISGHADPEAVSGPDGLRHFVRKPFRPSDLAAQIELALREVAGAGAA
jgi:CheY-like chemotaxis protein